MSAPVYSKRLFVSQGFTGSASFAPPAGTIIVVRDIWVYWNPVSAAVTRLFVEGDVGQTFSYSQFDLGSADQLAFWQGRQVVETSATVSQSGDPVDVSISGYVLTLP